MIEGYWQIGKEIIRENLQTDKFIESLVLELDKEKDGKRQYIVILNIKQEKHGGWKLDVDIEEISDESLKKYLWVGNPSGPNSPQDRLSTNNIEYLVSQTIPNLIKNLESCELKEKLEKLKGTIYFDLGNKQEIGSKEAQYERYRWIWDLSKLGSRLSPLKIREEIQKVDPGKKAKSAIELVGKEILTFIKNKTHLTKVEISLFTLAYNDEVLAQDANYKSYLYKSIIEDVFKEFIDGVCHICGENKKVTWNTTRFWFKFYMTDKVGFSSNLRGDKAFAKNYTLCQDCYTAILVGESYIRNNLSSYLAGYNVYIIPSFHLSNRLPIGNLERWAEFFKGKFDAISSLEGWHSFQRKLEEYKDFEKIQDNFLLNFLFGKKFQAAFKVYQLIHDVPPSRMDYVVKTSLELKRLGDKLFGEDREWFLSLRTFPYLFPRGKNERFYSKFILHFYHSLFSGLPIVYTELINRFLKRLWEIRFDKNFDDRNFSITVMKQILLLKFLEKLDLLKGGDVNMDERFISEIEITEELKEIIKEFKYSEAQLSLFMLGMVIGKIGIEQYKKGDTKKSILNKLQFQGINLNKLERLYNEIMEKIKQYKMLSGGETLYSLSKILFDKNKICWGLTPQENVFYILSGYSYITYKAITNKKRDKYTEIEEGENG